MPHNNEIVLYDKSPDNYLSNTGKEKQKQKILSLANHKYFKPIKLLNKDKTKENKSA